MRPFLTAVLALSLLGCAPPEPLDDIDDEVEAPADFEPDDELLPDDRATVRVDVHRVAYDTADAGTVDCTHQDHRHRTAGECLDMQLEVLRRHVERADGASRPGE